MRKQGKVISFEKFAEIFRTRVTMIDHILAMMAPWSNPQYLERIWCVYELCIAHLYGCKITIEMPASEGGYFVRGLTYGDDHINNLFKTLAATTVKKAHATVKSDLTNILQLIRHGPGYAASDASINSLIREWVTSLIDNEVNSRKATLNVDEYDEDCVIFFRRVE